MAKSLYYKKDTNKIYNKLNKTMVLIENPKHVKMILQKKTFVNACRCA